MPLMPCPEKYCDNRVSTTALICPKCGTKIKDFLEKELTGNYVAIPLNPIKYWYDWHFWYYWGCPYNIELEITEPGWINENDLLVRIGNIEILSPYSGIVVKSKLSLDKRLDLNYFITCNDFIVINPRKIYFPNEGANGDKQALPPNVFENLIQAIYDAEFGDNILKFLSNKLFFYRSSFDKKNKFECSRDLIEAARNLKNVNFYWLGKSEFNNPSYS